jgi:S-adenosylmethionine:tRNA ribosyltransferase-isomerase
VPLPPYIKRRPDTEDREYYQTVYAKSPGSIASPTAGLHFTEELLERISSKGVRVSYITLNIGYSTFSPIRVSDIRSHRMHKEYFRIPSQTFQLIYKTRSEGKRIFGVGTSVVRCLETVAFKLKNTEDFQEYEGYTDLFIYPSYKFNIVNCLVTNFHLPCSTLLILTCAFAGRELVMKAYQEAIRYGYRFYSYGDSMLII